MKNLVLIGLPGSGKTTIANLLKKELSFPMIDFDMYMEHYFNEDIQTMFSISEEYFREKETELCFHLKDNQGYIYATGGGVIKNKKNISYLKENGILFFLDRSVENISKNIDITHRPLLKQGKEKLYQLHAERYDLYKEASDVIINNNGKIEDALTSIIKQYKDRI